MAVAVFHFSMGGRAARLRDRPRLFGFASSWRTGEPDGSAAGTISVTPCQAPLSTSSRTSDFNVSATASIAGLRKPTSEKHSETGADHLGVGEAAVIERYSRIAIVQSQTMS